LIWKQLRSVEFGMAATLYGRGHQVKSFKSVRGHQRVNVVTCWQPSGQEIGKNQK
jgi:hypothetical protein